jgi:chromosome segregation ATPase
MAKNRTPEELQAWLSEATEDPIQLSLQKEELTNQNSALQESIVTLTQTISDKEAKILANDEAHKLAIEAKDEEIAGINATAEQNKAKIAELEAEINTLTESNATLIADAHQALVEKIVDMKISSGKIPMESKEDQMTIYMSRSNESLNDTLADLKTEIPNIMTAAPVLSAGVIDPESIPPVVAKTVKGENVDTVTDPVKPQSKLQTVSTDEEAIKNMFKQKR